jgi:hypothetical protein
MGIRQRQTPTHQYPFQMIPGLPQHMAMIPDPDDQGAQP